MHQASWNDPYAFAAQFWNDKRLLKSNHPSITNNYKY